METALFATINRVSNFLHRMDPELQNFADAYLSWLKYVHMYNDYKRTHTYPRLEISNVLLGFVSVRVVYVTVNI